MEAGRLLPDRRAEIRVRIDGAELTFACVDDGDLQVGGGRSDSHVVALVFDYLHENLLSHGRTMSDALRAADCFAKQFHGEVLGREDLLNCIRNRWIRLLVANLMADPAQSHGQRMNEFRPHRGLSVTIESTPLHVVHSSIAMVDIGNPEFLIVWRTALPRWRARWERLTRILICYSEPPSEWLQEDKMRTAIVQRARGKATRSIKKKSGK